MASSDDSKKPEDIPSAPDPDEDDLDDLDDMLDQFSSTKLSDSATKAPEASGPGRPTSSSSSTKPPTQPVPQPDEPPLDPPADEEEFARQLQAGMADMLKELESNPQMAKEFEDMMQQFGAPPPQAAQASPSQPAAPDATSSGAASSGEENFQETIRKTMERMKASSSSADAAAAGSGEGGEEDMMAALMRELQNGGGADGLGGDDAFSKVLLGMMEQLTNKDILYEPMKELDAKFPAWLEERTTGSKKGELSDEDLKRYTEQRALVREIVTRFEKDGYKDENAQDREYIVERMQKMQAAGAPPPDLVGDTASAQEAFSEIDQGCAQQ